MFAANSAVKLVYFYMFMKSNPNLKPDLRK